MNIINKTPRPLSVPLPGGKKLFLGPGKVGQVTTKALTHPPLAKLLEAGDIETVDGGESGVGDSSGVTFGQTTGQRRGGGGVVRKSGDR